MKKFYLFLLIAMMGAIFVNAQPNIFNPADADNVFTTTNHPALPAYGPIAKWGHTKSLNWGGTGTTTFKSYYYKGMPFRIKFPKSYQHNVADGKKYPILIFFHGAGEAGDAYDNEYQMYHGGNVFRDWVDNGSFDGFVFYEQSSSGYHSAYFGLITNMVDSLAKYCKLDVDRVIVNGLSSGGQGTWEFLAAYPKYIAGALPISAARAEYIAPMPTYITIPMWLFNGGQDTNPDPGNAQMLVDSFTNKGGSIKHTLYPTLGHACWDNAWADPGFVPFVNAAHKANPLVYYGRADFCPGDPISVKMGLQSGFYSYEWQKDGVTIAGATSNVITVTQLGSYRARFKRTATSAFSDWSPAPIVVKYKTTTQTPAIQVNGLSSKVLPAPDNSTTVPLMEPDGYASYKWLKYPDNTLVGNAKVFNAPPGQYVATVTEQYGCSALASSVFTVINANGANAPDAAKNVTAVAASKTSIQLDWSDNPHPTNNETGFEIYRATQAGGPYTLVSINVADNVSYLDQGLVTNTAYYYIVRAINNNGAAANSNEAAAKTASDNTAPSAPSNLQVTATTKSSVTISWGLSTDDLGVSKYDVYVNGKKAYTTATSPYTINSLSAPQTYNITVVARDAAGNTSPKSNQVTTTLAFNGLTYKYYEGTWTSLPDFNTLPVVESGTSSNISLSTRNRNDNFGFLWEGYIRIPVTGSYTFETNSDAGSKLYIGTYGYNAAALVNNDGVHTQQFRTGTITLNAGIYPIAITMFETTGTELMEIWWSSTAAGISRQKIPNSAFSGMVSTETIPTAPSGLAATSLAFNKIGLQWTDNSTNETGFEIARSTSAAGTFATIATVGKGINTYTDSVGLLAQTMYYYKVRSIGAAGESAYTSNLINASFKLNNDYTDASGNGRTLTPVNGPAFNATDKKEGAYSLHFDGSNDYVDISGTGSFTQEAHSQRTVAFWLKSESNSGTRMIFDLGGSDDGLACRINGNTLEVGIASTPFFVSRSTISAAFSAGVWRHVAVVYNAGAVYLYLDGALAASKTNLSFTSLGSTSSGSRLGNTNSTNAFNANPSAYFMGFIDDLNFFSTALTAAEVATVINGTYKVSNAATAALPASPSLPGNLLASGVSSSSNKVIWNDNSSNETGFELYRSLNNNSNYRLVATLGSNTSSQVVYTDSSLFANTVYYYKVRALGVGGNSGFSNEDSAKTTNTNPVVKSIAGFTMKYGTQKVLGVTATDIDGDALVLSAANLPSFATFVNNGDGTGSITFNPAIANTGSFNNIKITAADPNGGTASATFNMVVNDNNPPAVNPVTDVTMDEGTGTSLAVSATDIDGVAGLSWTTNLPSFGTLADNGNGNATITLNPGFGASGTYNVTLTVQDVKGGTASQSFVVTINDKNPNQKFLVNEAYASVGASPWNNMIGSSLLNLKNTDNETTSVAVRFSTPGWWQPYNLGATTGNNSGVYPDDVMRDYYYFGIYGGPETVDATISGLKPGGVYNFKFFASSIWTGVPDNGSTIYTIGSQSSTLSVMNNTSNTANINGAVADASGNIVFTMSKAPGTPIGYLNAFEFQSVVDDGSKPLKATNIVASLTDAGSVHLTWKDVAYNEQRYDVYRATDSLGTYTLLNPGAVNANAVAYDDSTTAATTRYYYKVQGVNTYGVSDFSDIVGITTLNNKPRVSNINDVTVKTGSSATVSFTVSDDPQDVVTVQATLPAFATLQNTGTGTYSVNVTPSSSNVGVYSASVTATDNKGASTVDAFQIVVNDKNSSSVYVNFGSDTAVAPQPWNNILGYPFTGLVTSNLKDESGNNTGISLTYVDGWAGAGDFGMKTGNNSGIYPDVVLKSAIYEPSTAPKRIKISGLAAGKLYNIVLLGSVNAGYNSTAIYSSGTKTVSLNAAYNSNKSVQLNGLVPDATGSITVTVTRDAAATYQYLSALVVQSYDAAVGVLSPKDVLVEPLATSRTQLNLVWSDRSDNETAMEVWRSTAANSGFTKIATLPANSTAYNDQGLTPNTRYYYEIRATNGATLSDFSNIGSATTPSSNVLVNLTWKYPTTIQPWNNTATNPQVGDRYGNLLDDQLNNTGLALNVVKDFNGEYAGGMNSGNNSYLFPDNVMVSNYWIDKGQVATLKLDGLDQTKKYRIGFEGSANWTGDMTATMTINGKTGYLNTYLNTSKAVYLDDLVPSADGELNIDFSATGTYGFIGSVIIQSYTDAGSSSGGSQLLTLQKPGVVGEKLMVAAKSDNALENGGQIQHLKAYPNPFSQTFNLSFDNLSSGKDVTVEVVNSKGSVVYSREFRLAAGSQKIEVNMSNTTLAPGMYIARISEKGKFSEAISLIKLKD